MRIFVIGTGRCGTVTFSKACQHITNYTSGHETTTHGKLGNDFDFPDNHIEIDPRLSYFLPLLIQKYPSALYVHLQRERESCIKSLSKRGSLTWFSQFHLGSKPDDMKKIAEIYYDNTVDLINTYYYIFRTLKQKFITIELNSITYDYIFFWDVIQAEGNKEKALSELKIKYNKS